MGNYPDVVPGQRVSFSANRENDINHILNAANGFMDGITSGKTTSSVRLQVWNASGSAFPAGSVAQIAITGHTMCDDAFPAVAFSDPEQPFGVFKSSVGANEISDLVMSGPASVVLSGGTVGYYAKPVSGGTFERGNEGCKILNLSGGTNAIVMLGDYKHDSGGGGGGGSVGFPDYTQVLWTMDSDHPDQTFPVTRTYSYPVWLYAYVTVSSSDNPQGIEITFNPESQSQQSTQMIAYGYVGDSLNVLISNTDRIPIPANTPFRLFVPDGMQYPYSYGLTIYRCL